MKMETKNLKTLKDIIEQMLNDTPVDDVQRQADIHTFAFFTRAEAREWVEAYEKRGILPKVAESNYAPCIFAWEVTEEQAKNNICVINFIKHFFNLDEPNEQTEKNV